MPKQTRKVSISLAKNTLGFEKENPDSFLVQFWNAPFRLHHHEVVPSLTPELLLMIDNFLHIESNCNLKG